MPRRPRVSFVATSRNDGHGGDLVGRMQHFIDGLAAQCDRHRLAAELVLVDWNPPVNAPTLEQALQWPADGGHLSVRILTVPPELHVRLANHEALALFQMIAKNVGIRRARGDSVLATNIDILFADELMNELSRGTAGNLLYRADRHDVAPPPPAGLGLGPVLSYCEANTVRINRPEGTYLLREGRFVPVHRPVFARIASRANVQWKVAQLNWHRRANRVGLGVRRLPFAARRARLALQTDPRRAARTGLKLSAGFLASLFAIGPTEPRAAKPSGFDRLQLVYSRAARLYRVWRAFRFLPQLNTNACGDFTLLRREDWFRLRGYPEWEIFSWHLDSVLLHQAVAEGFRIRDLPPRCRSYHLDHTSGWAPDTEEQLFTRIRAAGIPFLSLEEFLDIARQLHTDAREQVLKPFNEPSWGFADEAIPDVVVTHAGWEGASARPPTFIATTAAAAPLAPPASGER